MISRNELSLTLSTQWFYSLRAAAEFRIIPGVGELLYFSDIFIELSNMKIVTVIVSAGKLIYLMCSTRQGSGRLLTHYVHLD